MQTETLGVIQALLFIGTPIFTVAGAYFTLKHGQNGQRKDIAQTRKDMGEIKGSIGGLSEGQTEIRVEVGKIATGLEDTRGWVSKIDDRLHSHIKDD